VVVQEEDKDIDDEEEEEEEEESCNIAVLYSMHMRNRKGILMMYLISKISLLSVRRVEDEL
jgi:hypothetical protein